MLVRPTMELFDRPLTNRQRAFLRAMRQSGGSVRLVGSVELGAARACVEAGYATIAPKRDRAFITQLGCAYLDRLTRVE